MSVDFVYVFLIGFLVGVGELVARYRDAPFSALVTLPALLYNVVNGLAGVIALALVRGFKVDFGATDPATIALVQVLASGLGAMAVFRSSVFTFRVGDQDVGVGPSSLLQIILGAADRAVDRLRARSRAQEVARIMEDVSFPDSYQALPAFCLALMQNLPVDDQKELGEEIASLSQAQMVDEVKSLILGLQLMNTVGPGVLQAAVDSLEDRIKYAPPPDPPPPAPPPATGPTVDT